MSAPRSAATKAGQTSLNQRPVFSVGDRVRLEDQREDHHLRHGTAEVVHVRQPTNSFETVRVTVRRDPPRDMSQTDIDRGFWLRNWEVRRIRLVTAAPVQGVVGSESEGTEGA